MQYSATGADLPTAIDGDLNIAVITAPLVDSNINLPSGYAFGFLTGGNATLVGSGSNAAVPGLVLIGASSIDSLSLSGTGTVIGGNGSNDITVTNGQDYVYGGTGRNLINLDTGGEVVYSVGTDTITTNGFARNSTINVAGSALYFGDGDPLSFVVGGSSTLTGFSGNVSGNGSSLVFATGGIDFQGGAGASTVIGYSNSTIVGGAAATLFFGSGISDLSFTGGAAVDTIVAGDNHASVTVGSAGALMFGASNYDNIISTAGGPLTDLEFGTAAITLGGAANNLIAISYGSINAANSSGSNTIFDNGSASIVAGSGSTAIVVGSQNSTLVAGSAANLFIIPALAQTSRQFLVQNFNGAQDFIDLVGYASSAPAAAYNSAVTTSTSFGPEVTVTLLDGTKIVFQTPANLASFSFQ